MQAGKAPPDPRMKMSTARERPGGISQPMAPATAPQQQQQQEHTPPSGRATIGSPAMLRQHSKPTDLTTSASAARGSPVRSAALSSPAPPLAHVLTSSGSIATPASTFAGGGTSARAFTIASVSTSVSSSSSGGGATSARSITGTSSASTIPTASTGARNVSAFSGATNTNPLSSSTGSMISPVPQSSSSLLLHALPVHKSPRPDVPQLAAAREADLGIGVFSTAHASARATTGVPDLQLPSSPKVRAPDSPHSPSSTSAREKRAKKEKKDKDKKEKHSKKATSGDKSASLHASPSPRETDSLPRPHRPMSESQAIEKPFAGTRASPFISSQYVSAFHMTFFLGSRMCACVAPSLSLLTR